MKFEATGAAARAGRLACFCPPGVPVEGQTPDRRDTFLLAGGFALAVLAQTLALGVLPLAGMLLAPEPRYATLPYIAMLLGAGVATFPASFLLDAFGRRAAFALGASHGIAGGLVMAWALSVHAFIPFCLGAFWLGIAQGFSLFYRHEAAIGAGAKGRSLAIGLVFGAGALAGLAGPGLVAIAEKAMPSSVFVGTALLCALTQVAVLSLAMVKSGGVTLTFAAPTQTSQVLAQLREALAPTIIAAAAWFGMTALMLSSPYAMAGCGIPLTGVMSAVAWHVVAMYAPAFVTDPLSRLIGVKPLAVLGLSLIVVARVIAGSASTYTQFTLMLVVLAVGWSLATAASTLWLHRDGPPSRLLLAGHDAVLFAAAIGGALLAATMPLGLG